MTAGIVAESDLSGNLQSEYVFFGSDRVARKDLPANAVFYYFSDHLKTASVITDATGTIKSESDYYPWGGELQFANGDSNHYKFTGKERDAETGLDYFGARHCANGLGRFITPDWAAVPVPVPYADLTDPQSFNQYTYVRNLPTTNSDADGHDTVGDILYAGITLVVHYGGTALEIAKLSVKAVNSLPKPELKGVNELVQAGSTAVDLVKQAGSTLANACTCQESNSQNNNKKNENNSKSDNASDQQGGTKDGRTAQDPLRRDANGNPVPDPEAEGAAHTQLGTKTSKSQAGNPRYKQGMEYDANGNPVRRVDQTNHGRADHANPREHQIDPNTGKIGPPQPLPPTPKTPN